MSWLGSLFGRRKLREAQARERAGDLAAAVELYLDADAADEASRVLLLRAAAAGDSEGRLAFAAAAVRAATGAEALRTAKLARATLSFEVARARRPPLAGDLLDAGRELEAAGAHELAADAYALAGDTQAEVRALTQAGAIERLEARLERDRDASRDARALSHVLAEVEQLDRSCERSAALAAANAWLHQHAPRALPDEADRVRAVLGRIEARLVRGPLVDLEVRGEPVRVAFGDEVVVGRSEGTLVVPAPGLSRRHLRLWREGEEVWLEDLGSSNGTFVAGARLAEPLALSGPLTVRLGRDVPLSLTPMKGGVLLELSGHRVMAPLGPMLLAGLEPASLVRSADGLIQLHARGQALFAGPLQLGPAVELCRGDEVSSERGGAVVLRVVSDVTPGEP